MGRGSVPRPVPALVYSSHPLDLVAQLTLAFAAHGFELVVLKWTRTL